MTWRTPGNLVVHPMLPKLAGASMSLVDINDSRIRYSTVAMVLAENEYLKETLILSKTTIFWAVTDAFVFKVVHSVE